MSLFAGKLHAALYRAWKMQVKGRDWFDVVWFLRKGIPLNVHYLEMCMRNCNELQPDESLTRAKILTLLLNRIEVIDFASAKEHVALFLREPTQLELWSIDFFKHWFNMLKMEYTDH